MVALEDAVERRFRLVAHGQRDVAHRARVPRQRDYCLAAHTLAGKMAGLSADAMLAARRGTPGGDARLDALSTFVRSVVGSRGTVAQDVVDAFKGAGFTDAQVVDTLFAISSITFTNLLNRVNDTVLDFPAARN